MERLQFHDITFEGYVPEFCFHLLSINKYGVFLALITNVHYSPMNKSEKMNHFWLYGRSNLTVFEYTGLHCIAENKECKLHYLHSHLFPSSPAHLIHETLEKKSVSRKLQSQGEREGGGVGVRRGGGVCALRQRIMGWWVIFDVDDDHVSKLIDGWRGERTVETMTRKHNYDDNNKKTK